MAEKEPIASKDMTIDQARDLLARDLEQKHKEYLRQYEALCEAHGIKINIEQPPPARLILTSMPPKPTEAKSQEDNGEKK